MSIETLTPEQWKAKGETERIQGINAMCLIAGRTDLLTDFISKGLTKDAVQTHLLKLASDESAKHIVSSHLQSRNKSAVVSGIQGIRQMLSEARTVASQSDYSNG